MAPELDVYARLTENQLLNRAHPEEGMFIAESPKVIERALDAGCIPVSLLMETKHVQGEAKEMIERCGDIPVYTAEFDVLTKITGFKLTRGMLCAMHRRKLPSMREICENAKTHCGAGRSGQSDEYRGDFSLSGSNAYGCGSADTGSIFRCSSFV